MLGHTLSIRSALKVFVIRLLKINEQPKEQFYASRLPHKLMRCEPEPFTPM